MYVADDRSRRGGGGGYDGPFLQQQNVVHGWVEPAAYAHSSHGGNYAAAPYTAGPAFESIPRPRVRHRRDEEDHDATVRRTPARKRDTLDDTAIERIYDEFRFLDEEDAPRPPTATPSSSSARPIIPDQMTSREDADKGEKEERGWAALRCVPALLQLLVSIGLIAFGVIRFMELYSLPSISNLLLDLVKPEEFAKSEAEGVAIIRIRVGTACFVPALLYLLGGLAGFWPLVAHPKRRGMQLAHIAFTSIGLVLWFPAVLNSSWELNLRYVQLRMHSEMSSDYYAWVALAVISCVEIFLLPAATIAWAVTAITYSHGTTLLRSGSLISSTVASCVTAAAAVANAVYLVQSSMSDMADWKVSVLSPTNPGVLYSFGLVEALVCSFSLLVSLAALTAATLPRPRLYPSIVLLTCLTLSSLLIYVLSPSRILAIAHNLGTLRPEVDDPLSRTSLITLYSLVVAHCVCLCVQLWSFCSIHHFSPPRGTSPHQILLHTAC